MYETRFTKKQVYDNYAKSVSKPKNANQQAARTMKSAGIGSLGGKTTTASAKSIQDSFRKKRERRRKNKGSTYDEVPQVLTQGIVQKPKAKPVKETGYEKVKRVFNNAMERFGIFDEPTSTYDTVKPQNVYKSSFFSAPKVTTIILPDMMPTTSSPYRPLPSGPDTRNFGTNIGADPSPEKPESAKFDIYDIFNTKEKVMRGSVPGLMSPPTMDQTKPETPGLTIEDAVNRAILATTKEYVIKPGDTLTKIARRNNTTVKELAEINKIEDVDVIKAGASLRVPKTRSLGTRISTRGDEDPDAKFYNSFTEEAGSPPEKFIARLIGSESSGNPDAEYTVKDGRRYVGLLQFGEARLTDYKKDTGTKFTQDQFKKDLKLQVDVSLWHIEDIDKTIDDIIENSKFKNRDGLRAVAHLGGKTGMKKFVKSNGKYNPEDELGTSLLDYYRKFSN